MDNQIPELTLRKFPIGNYVIGIIFLALAAIDHSWSVGSFNFILFMLEIAIGLFLILSGSILTIHADRASQMLMVSFRSLFHGSIQKIPIAEIAAIQLEISTSGRNRSSGGPTYQIVAVRKDGQRVHFFLYFSSRDKDKDRMVGKLRAFLGVGGDDTGLGNLIQDASEMARHQFQEQQEPITGDEMEERITDGVHWTLETKAFGGMPVSRWHSPDFRCEGTFLYLTQIEEGEGTHGGLMAAMGKMVYKTSMTLFGFTGDLTPNESHGELLAPLDPQLEGAFSAYTSDSSRARQILNPGAIQALTSWTQSHPLTKNNRTDQLYVLFSPLGLYLATMGLTNPGFLDDTAKLGAALIKAQGGA
jgi:hypothetical protein